MNETEIAVISELPIERIVSEIMTLSQSAFPHHGQLLNKLAVSDRSIGYLAEIDPSIIAIFDRAVIGTVTYIYRRGFAMKDGEFDTTVMLMVYSEPARTTE